MSLSTWELFKEELLRNISPNGEEIRRTFQFLLDNELCTPSVFKNLVHVRLMASYEEGVNSYLHPPIELKQGNVKAEILHLGTIYEALLDILLKGLNQRK